MQRNALGMTLVYTKILLKYRENDSKLMLKKFVLYRGIR